MKMKMITHNNNNNNNNNDNDNNKDSNNELYAAYVQEMKRNVSAIEFARRCQVRRRRITIII